MRWAGQSIPPLRATAFAPSPSYEYGCQGLAELHAALHEYAVALGRVSQQRIEHLVGSIRMIMPPTTAHADVEVIGDLIIQDAFELKPVALAARRIGTNREVVGILRFLPNPGIGRIESQLPLRREPQIRDGAEAQSIKLVILGDDQYGGRKRCCAGTRPDGISNLGATVSVITLVPVMISRKSAEPHARADER